MANIKEVVVGDRTIKFEFDKFAKLASSAVMVSCGDTQVLVTVCASEEPKEGQDFFPLTVDYIEKYYAAGRIPGGFIKRETKPSERETLIARVIDRPLRPSFPEGYLCDTHVVCTVMSVDGINHPASLALVGASMALSVSEIPFNGPVASLRVGLKDGKFTIDPPDDELSDLDLNIAANPDAVLMVEANANFLSEAQMLDAVDFARETMKPLFAAQLECQKAFGKAKRTVKDPLDEEAYAKVAELGQAKVREALQIKEKKSRASATREINRALARDLNPDQDPALAKKLAFAIDTLNYRAMRAMVLDEKKRIDGRSFDQVRPLYCELGVLRRAHGSALFQRGETQALGVVTLGSSDDEQRTDSILQPAGSGSKRFMLHYNFPPYSVGEARPLRAPGRREVGHGFLAEKALMRVIPPADQFSYTIRLVSEVLESNGSSSMATVCAGTMAMLHAGVPIKEPVAGIAMGLIKEGEKYAVLSDILGDEDHLGDMDFKVTGSSRGITALQMDIKIGGLPRQIMAEALEQARKGRDHILKALTDTISAPGELSEFAPRAFQMKIKDERIRDLIGPGGKMIKKIVADTGVKIEVEDSGIVTIMAPDARKAEAAKNIVRSVTADPEVGAIYLGKVRRVVDFGAFVEIRPGLEGLVHISQLDEKRVERVSDFAKEGDDMLIKILEIDRQGKIKLSRKEALGKRPTFSLE